MRREAMRERWLEWRRSPQRGELLDELRDAFAAERGRASATTGSGDWAGLVTLPAATIGLEHVTTVATRRVRPRLLALLVRVEWMTAEEAVAQLDLGSSAGGEALGMLWTELSTEGLRAALGRLAWEEHPVVREELLAVMVRTVVDEGWGEEAVGWVMRATEPRRSRMLAELLPALDEGQRARAEEVIAGAIAGAEDVFAVVALMQAVRGEDGLDAELRARVEPEIAAEWTRLAEISEVRARADAWEWRMAQLGPLATLEESRRWVAVAREAIAADPEDVHRLQTWVPRALWDEAIAGLPAAVAAAARVWLVWGDGSGDAREALAAVLAAELSAERRAWLLAMLVERLDGAGAITAARALLATPERSLDDAILAALRLPREEQERLADAWCREDPLVNGRPELAIAAVPAVLRMFGEAAAGARGELLELVRGEISGWDEEAQVATLALFAGWMPETERVALARRGLAVGGTTRAIGLLVGLLPAEEVAAALVGPIARARGEGDAYARWAALDELVSGLPEEVGAQVLRDVWRASEDASEIFAFPRWAMDVALRRALVEHELAHPYRPYTAWLLGGYARDLPAEERGAVLERAIDEFAAIAGAPTSPGNDAGPFVEMADLLDEAQTRRALAVVEQMATAADWGADLEYSREHLALRLGQLGHVAEAAERLRGLASERAWGLGALVGTLLAQGTGWEEAVRRAGAEGGDEASAGVLWALPAEARVGRVDVAEGLLTWVARAEERVDALSDVLESFGAELPARRWAAEIAAVASPGERAGLLLKAGRLADGATIVDEMIASLAEIGDWEDRVDDVCAVAGLLPAAAREAMIRRWLQGPPRTRTSTLHALSEEPGRELAGVLRALGGDAAVVAAGREIVAVARLLD